MQFNIDELTRDELRELIDGGLQTNTAAFYEIVKLSRAGLGWDDWNFLASSGLTLRHVPNHEQAINEQKNGGSGDSYSLVHLPFTNGTFDLKKFLDRTTEDAKFVYSAFNNASIQKHSPPIDKIYDVFSTFFFRALCEDTLVKLGAHEWITDFLNLLLFMSILQTLTFETDSGRSYLILDRGEDAAKFYDCSKYPLGKCGTKKFSAVQVKLRIHNNAKQFEVSELFKTIVDVISDYINTSVFDESDKPAIMPADYKNSFYMPQVKSSTSARAGFFPVVNTRTIKRSSSPFTDDRVALNTESNPEKKHKIEPKANTNANLLRRNVNEAGSMSQTIFINDENKAQHLETLLAWLQSDFKSRGAPKQGHFWHNRDMIEEAFGNCNAMIVLNIQQEVIGYMIWSLYDGGAEINIVEVKSTYGRQGIFTKMLTDFSQKFPDVAVLTGSVIEQPQQTFRNAGWQTVPYLNSKLKFFKLLKPVLNPVDNPENGCVITVNTNDFYQVKKHPDRFKESMQYFKVDLDENGKLHAPIVTGFHYEGYIGVYVGGKLIAEGKAKHLFNNTISRSGLLVIDRLEPKDPVLSDAIKGYFFERQQETKEQEQPYKRPRGRQQLQSMPSLFQTVSRLIKDEEEDAQIPKKRQREKTEPVQFQSIKSIVEDAEIEDKDKNPTETKKPKV